MDHQIQAVRRMQDYIKDHINEDISIDTIAKEISYSASYARKIFIKHLGMTPAVYIRRLKLSKSALRLRDENCQILDVNLAAIPKSIRPVLYQSGFSLLTL